MVIVAQISGSNKSYGCVDDIHANQVVKVKKLYSLEHNLLTLIE